MQSLSAIIDGSLLEGGGQILRNSIALSGLLGFRLEINKIRGNRKRPGLQSQHLTCVKLVEAITNSETQGAKLDSCVLKFVPGVFNRNIEASPSQEKEKEKVQELEHEHEHEHEQEHDERVIKGKKKEVEQAKESQNRGKSKLKAKANAKGGKIETVLSWEQTERFDADIKTAGSVGLLIQASLPCLLFAPGNSVCHLKGGTNTMLSPQIEYVQNVFAPTMRRHFGIDFNLDVIRRGFYPRGGGEIKIETKPVKFLPPINITERGELQRISIMSFVAGRVPFDVCKKMSSSARMVLQETITNEEVFAPDQNVKYDLNNSYGDGGGIVLVAETTTGCLIASSALLEKGVSADDVGAMAGRELATYLNDGGCMDEYLQDQLIIYMALAQGESRILTGPISLHTETAIYVASNLTKAKFEITKPTSKQNLIVCQGIGYTNKYQS